MAIQFSPELRERVLAGEITVTIRLWSRNQAREGGQYRVGDGLIEIDAIEELPFAAIDEKDVLLAGSPTGSHYGSAQPTPDRSPRTRLCAGSSSTWSSRREFAASDQPRVCRAALGAAGRGHRAQPCGLRTGRG